MSCLGGFNLLPQTFFCASVTSSNQEMSKCTGSPKRAWMSKCTCLYSSLFLLYSWFFCISSVSVFLGFSLNAPGSQRGQLKRSVMRHRLCDCFSFFFPLFISWKDRVDLSRPRRCKVAHDIIGAPGDGRSQKGVKLYMKGFSHFFATTGPRHSLEMNVPSNAGECESGDGVGGGQRAWV